MTDEELLRDALLAIISYANYAGLGYAEGIF